MGITSGNGDLELGSTSSDEEDLELGRTNGDWRLDKIQIIIPKCGDQL